MWIANLNLRFLIFFFLWLNNLHRTSCEYVQLPETYNQFFLYFEVCIAVKNIARIWLFCSAHVSENKIISSISVGIICVIYLKWHKATWFAPLFHMQQYVRPVSQSRIVRAVVYKKRTTDVSIYGVKRHCYK